MHCRSPASFAATGNHIWFVILGIVAVDAVLLWFWKLWNLQSAVVACRCQRGGHWQKVVYWFLYFPIKIISYLYVVTALTSFWSFKDWTGPDCLLCQTGWFLLTPSRSLSLGIDRDLSIFCCIRLFWPPLIIWACFFWSLLCYCRMLSVI